jgi:hypothetical protein
MKTLVSALTFIAIGALGVLSGEALYAPSVESVRGNALYSEWDGQWRILEPGQLLKNGTIIKTGFDGAASVSVNENSRELALLNETRLTFGGKLYHANFWR